MPRWILTLTDGTEYELTDQEYRFLQEKIEAGKKLVFYQDKAINTAYIRHIKMLNPPAQDGQHMLLTPRAYTPEDLKNMYQVYLWNLKDFEVQMKTGKIHGFGNQAAQNDYLSNHFKPQPVSFDEFYARYELDRSRGEEFIFMQQWFWR